jgi:hypothetical protein
MKSKNGIGFLLFVSIVAALEAESMPNSSGRGLIVASLCMKKSRGRGGQ